jgi:hypothetical protein
VMRLSGGPIDSIPSAASASLSISCSKKRRCAAGSGVARTVSTTRLAPLAWQVKNASRGRPASVANASENATPEVPSGSVALREKSSGA